MFIVQCNEIVMCLKMIALKTVVTGISLWWRLPANEGDTGLIFGLGRSHLPICHNYWTCSLEPGSCNSWAHKPQLLKPTPLKLMLCNQRSPPTMRNLCTMIRVLPALDTTRESPTQQPRPSTVNFFKAIIENVLSNYDFDFNKSWKSYFKIISKEKWSPKDYYSKQIMKNTKHHYQFKIYNMI